MDDVRPPERREIYVGEESIVYCFDFSNESPVAAGETLSNPVISISDGSAIVSLGSPIVLTSDFIEYDENGDEIGTVDSGKGVKVAITGVSEGTCTLTCKVTLSGGSKPARQVVFRVR